MVRTDLLADEVAIVTGAGRNIGREIATTFAAEGAKIGVVDLVEERAQETATLITEDGGDAVAIAADVSSESAVETMVSSVEDALGPIDVLVNNAAITERTDFFDLTVDEFDKTLAVNLRGTFLCTRAASRSMRTSGGGRVVNFASTSAHVARPNSAAYAASKSGVLNLTKTSANALAEYGIRVNAISPTRTGSRVGQAEVRSGPADADILVDRWGEPKDQANAALFLASSMSEFVNGTELVVDGGALASSYDK